MDTLRQDLRYAVRQLLRQPGFTLVALLTLALGIGANTSLFGLLNAVVLRPLAFPEPDRLVMVWADLRARSGPAEEYWGPADWADLRAQNRSLSDLVAIANTGLTLTGQGDPARISTGLVTGTYFAALGVPPALGRGFLPEEDRPGAARVVVVSHGLWQRRFGGDPALLGKTLILGGEPHTVVGIAPADFHPPLDEVDLWRPLRLDPTSGRGEAVLRTFGRLRPGVSMAAAAADLNTVAARMAQMYPETNTGIGVHLVGLHEQLVGNVRPAMLLLLGAVFAVLLIACVNLANLLLVRAGTRSREVAVRVALGADRTRLLRQFLTESMLLAVVGGALGGLLSVWGVDALVSLLPAELPRRAEIGLDGRVFAFALALSLGTGLLFGLIPALQASRPGLASAMTSGGLRTGRAERRTRSGLVVLELTLALTLLAGAGLLLQSLMRLQQVDPGFTPEGVLTVELSLPRTVYPEPERQGAFYTALLNRLADLPGVTSAAAASLLPLSGANTDMSIWFQGRPEPAPGRLPSVWTRSVTPGYFHTVQIPVQSGRDFSTDDRTDGAPVVVVNQTMAQRFWPNGNPLGSRISVNGPAGPWRTVVGLVGDVHHNGLDRQPLAELYLPMAQKLQRDMTVVLRTNGDPTTLIAGARAEVRQMDPDLPVSNIGPMTDLLRESVALPRLYLSLFGVFATLALLLAGLGIYGVTAHTVGQRTPEIGLRMALGAQPDDVLRLIVRGTLRVTLVGIGLGVAVALAAGRMLQGLLFDVRAADPTTLIAVAVLLTAVSLLAAYLPARRAMRIGPMVALRAE